MNNIVKYCLCVMSMTTLIGCGSKKAYANAPVLSEVNYNGPEKMSVVATYSFDSQGEDYATPIVSFDGGNTWYYGMGESHGVELTILMSNGSGSYYCYSLEDSQKQVTIEKGTHQICIKVPENKDHQPSKISNVISFVLE